MDSKFDLTSFIFFPKTEYIATLEITIASDLIDKISFTGFGYN